MEWSQVLAFVVIATVVTVTPGPNFLLITQTIAEAGQRQAYANIGGFATAFFVHGSLSIYGVSVVVANTPNLLYVIKMAGAAYLCFLGVKSLQAVSWGPGNRVTKYLLTLRVVQMRNGASTRHSDTYSTSIPRTTQRLMPSNKGNVFKGWREGFITLCLNPKTSLFYIAVFPQFIGLGNSTEYRSFILVAIHVTINALWFAVVTVTLAKLLSSSRRNSFVNPLKLVSGIVLVILSGGFAFLAVA